MIKLISRIGLSKHQLDVQGRESFAYRIFIVFVVIQVFVYHTFITPGTNGRPTNRHIHPFGTPFHFICSPQETITRGIKKMGADRTAPVVLGPVTWVYLARHADSQASEEATIALKNQYLDAILPIYAVRKSNTVVSYDNVF